VWFGMETILYRIPQKLAAASKPLHLSDTGRVTKAHLVDQLAASAELTKQESEKIVGLLIAAITKALTDGDKLEIRGFGSFKVKDRKSRVARNPRTGETVQVPAQRVATFRPSKELSALLNSNAPAAETAKG
jgi:integration host factor subunit beta